MGSSRSPSHLHILLIMLVNFLSRSQWKLFGLVLLALFISAIISFAANSHEYKFPTPCFPNSHCNKRKIILLCVSIFGRKKIVLMKTTSKQQFKGYLYVNHKICESATISSYLHKVILWILPAEVVAYTLPGGSSSYAFPWLWHCRTWWSTGNTADFHAGLEGQDIAEITQRQS